MSGFHEEPASYASTRVPKAAFKAAFKSWNEVREGSRCELKYGRIVMHAGSSRQHAWLAHRFAAALSSRLDASAWAVGGSDIAVEIDDTVRDPDVVVEQRADDGSERSPARPILIVEVLSPTSPGRDLRTKVEEYLSLTSLPIYIVASQDEPICWVGQRGHAEFPTEPAEIAGRTSTIEIASPGVSLPLGDIYRGIGTA